MTAPDPRPDLASPSPEARAALFAQQRPRLVRLAYRMLGSVADAEDTVQDAWVRFLAADAAAVRDPGAFLRTIVTRLSLNALKSARRRRETYLGASLPDPLLEEDDAEICDDITLPLMIALERLSPLERAAFLLHEAFGMDFQAVGAVLRRSPTTCRKLASRARAHVHAARPRFVADADEGRRLAAAFFKASREGDMAALSALLTADVVTYADGGGRIAAPRAPLVGRQATLERFTALATLFARRPSRLVRFVRIDGLPGFITIEEGGDPQTTALNIESGRITAIYVMRNPDKLRHIPDARADAEAPPRQGERLH